MKREIKFRALLRDATHVWWEYYTTFEQPAWIDIKGWDVIEKDLQHTGLKDKNGKEIYEGDILECNDWKAKVLYNGGMFSLFASDGYEMLPIWKEYEIIGNIYSNPELLNN